MHVTWKWKYILNFLTHCGFKVLCSLRSGLYPSPRIDEEQSRVTQTYSEFFLIISLSLEDEIAAILFDFDVNAPECIIISEVVDFDLGVQTQLPVGLFSVHAWWPFGWIWWCIGSCHMGWWRWIYIHVRAWHACCTFQNQWLVWSCSLFPVGPGRISHRTPRVCLQQENCIFKFSLVSKYTMIATTNRLCTMPIITTSGSFKQCYWTANWSCTLMLLTETDGRFRQCYWTANWSCTPMLLTETNGCFKQCYRTANWSCIMVTRDIHLD